MTVRNFNRNARKHNSVVRLMIGQQCIAQVRAAPSCPTHWRRARARIKGKETQFHAHCTSNPDVGMDIQIYRQYVRQSYNMGNAPDKNAINGGIPNGQIHCMSID